jgi:hypothetical protein
MAFKHALALVPVYMFLSGCASTSFPGDVPMTSAGLQQGDYLPEATDLHPKKIIARPDPESKREAALATLKPHSAEWEVLHDQIEADREKRLNAQLRICSGCFSQENAAADQGEPTPSESDTASSTLR